MTANPDREDLAGLLARVEAATGPDRELDRDLAITLMGWCLHPLDRQRDDSAQSDTGWTCLDCGADSWGNVGPSGQGRHASVPALTASLDAALALIERVLPGWTVDLNVARTACDATRPQIAYAQLWRNLAPGVGSVDYTRGSTPALALLAALLKAKLNEDANG